VLKKINDQLRKLADLWEHFSKMLQNQDYEANLHKNDFIICEV